MKQVFNCGGSIAVEEVPAPVCGDNEVLVSNAFSLISAGTESASLAGSGGNPLVGAAARVIRNPELIKKGIDMVRREGLEKTLRAASGKPESLLVPLGYSCSGTVIAVGRNVSDLSAGDRVACAGAGFANHADIVTVPRNLACKVPDGVALDEAAFMTLGSIAIQGLRRADVQFGDRVVVVGLGLLGQIACQVLKSAGAHVIGIDLMPDRLALAKELGADECIPAGGEAVKGVLKATGGIGADAVVIYAATRSSEPVKQAMDMARKKGRVVVVGDVGMSLERPAFYEKELDFLISTSYGPGRYDRQYEEKGVDYPVGYVRWTENRNMQEFLRMLSKQRINVRRLIDCTFPVADAVAAYGTLSSEKRPIGVLLKYSEAPLSEPSRKVTLVAGSPADRINVALIGAGGFAQAFHLPNIKKIPLYNLKAVVTRTSHHAKKMAEDYGAGYYSTDYKDVIKDPDVNLVLIATRHNLHAPIIVEAANAGKHVFVEKPVGMTYGECAMVREAVTRNKVNLAIGFNRRFSPLSQKAKRVVEQRRSPLMITYRINSAGMKKDHWINDPVEGGGAIIGEGCHFFDYCNWMTGSEPLRVDAEMISSKDGAFVDANNLAGIVRYRDGSVATIVYTTMGNEASSKERIEMYLDGGVIVIDDFKSLSYSGIKAKNEELPQMQKGQFELIDAYARLLAGKGSDSDLPGLEDAIRATECTLKALEAAKTGKVQEWGPSSP